MDSNRKPSALVLLALHVGIALAVQLPQITNAPDFSWLMPRAECPANMFQCPRSLGEAFSDICCYTGQTCALDNNNSPACCPSGAVCTGAAPTGNPSAAPTQEVSYVSNTYFSFPYAMTSFENSASCASAVSACSENYDICTQNLGGEGGFAVTIEVPGGGGVTVEGSGQDLGASATEVCSSLSSEACSTLDATECASFDDDSAATSMRIQRGSGMSVITLISIVAMLLR